MCERMTNSELRILAEQMDDEIIELRAKNEQLRKVCAEMYGLLDADFCAHDESRGGVPGFRYALADSKQMSRWWEVCKRLGIEVGE